MVALVAAATSEAAIEVQPEREHLFRRKLAIQIFPEPGHDFPAFHSLVPPRTAAGRRAGAVPW
jgi:hypothetical protein